MSGLCCRLQLAPEWRFPTQLDEYIAVAEWLPGEGGKERNVSTKARYHAIQHRNCINAAEEESKNERILICV